jgi:hypothetical protein
MEVPYTEKFKKQLKEYNFCFTCEHCAYFDNNNQTCLHEFPNQMHRSRYYAENPKTILFCKEFDLC